MDSCRAYNCTWIHVSACYSMGRSQGIHSSCICMETQGIQPLFLMPDTLCRQALVCKLDTCCELLPYNSNKACARWGTATQNPNQLFNLSHKPTNFKNIIAILNPTPPPTLDLNKYNHMSNRIIPISKYKTRINHKKIKILSYHY